jgi:para-nitrobenzyl esterase
MGRSGRACHQRTAKEWRGILRFNRVLLVLSLCLLAYGSAAAEPGPIVAVEGGEIQGSFEADGEIAVFKGIPYAAPPVDELRWKPPQPAKLWKETRDATRFESICPQGNDNESNFFGRMIDGQGMGWFRKVLFKLAVGLFSEEAQSENCLYLNVRTANLGGTETQPVMVWIHGGGHQTGSGPNEFYQSDSLTLRGVVLVTLNYRLGLIGYFAHPPLSAESNHSVSGNYGTLDQIAALRWVRDNIAAFGGDPSKVTIFGESAGGESVAHMMTSPLARGLLHRAIMQSASTGGLLIHLDRPVISFMSAEAAGEAFAKKVTGDSEDPIQELRALSPDELYSALRKFPEFDTYTYPVIDGYVLRKSVLQAFLDGDQARVPLLVGSNSDEGSLLYSLGDDALYGSSPGPETADAYTQYLRDSLGTNTEKILELHPVSDDASVFDAASAVYGDSRFGTPARLYARQMAAVGQPAYLYFFTRVPPSPKQTVGAFHAAEIVFVFGKTVPLFPTDEQDQIITQAMGDYWTQFAKTGDPNMEGLPPWPAFAREEQRNMVLGAKIDATPVERSEAYDIFEEYWMQLIEAVRPERSR